MMTKHNIELSDELISRQIYDLVNRFYKILPIKESGEPTLKQYQESLLREMLGCQSLIVAFHQDDRYISLLSILQYMIDHDPDVSIVRSDVFRAIGILKNLQKKYCKDEELAQ